MHFATPRTCRRALLGAALVAAAMVASAPSSSAATIFAGDPIDPATGLARVLLPGVPLVSPGADGKYDGNGDVFNPSIVGDVDLVLRTGNTFGGGMFPPPAAGVAVAPVVRPGGGGLGGSEVSFDVVASDGATTPAAGHPLVGPELDGRAALVFAYADLDGDGIIGPTDADGALDHEIERQEVLAPVGRQVAVFLAGVAHGSLGVSLGAPASAGGLGLVLVGAAATGGTPPVFTDGPWAATLLPFMPSTDPDRILHGNPRAADPDYLADVEIEMGSNRHFVPTGADPVIGTPFAIPLDGSSVTVDLARSESGPAVGAGLGVPIDAASYIADPARRLLPSVDPTGTKRLLLDASTSLNLADDGPGNAATLCAFATDLLGSPTDPSTPLSVSLEVGQGLRIASPDADGDSAHEAIQLSSAACVPVVLDDAGGVGDAPAVGRLVASVGGVPTAWIDVVLVGGGQASSWSELDALLRTGGNPEDGTLRLTGTFGADAASVDPINHAVTLLIEADDNVIYSRTFGIGSFTANRAGSRFLFKDPRNAGDPRTRSLLIKTKPREPDVHQLKFLVRGIDLSGVDSNASLGVHLQIGATQVDASLGCAGNSKGTIFRCALR